MHADDRHGLPIQLNSHALAVGCVGLTRGEQWIAAEQAKPSLITGSEVLVGILADQLFLNRCRKQRGEFLKPDHIGALGAKLLDHLGAALVGEQLIKRHHADGRTT